MRMIWFNVIKVEYPSEEPPQGKPVSTLYNYVLEEDDIPYYRLFKYGSEIDIYDMHNYFLARQYVYDVHADAKVLYAEYRLTLTEEAWQIVNKLLSKPFQCYVTRHMITFDDVSYDCYTYHPVHIPNDKGIQLQWSITVNISRGSRVVSVNQQTTIPFNCGPLYPLWERAVECWIKEMTRLKATRNYKIKSELLQHQYLNGNIIPVYNIH